MLSYLSQFSCLDKKYRPAVLDRHGNLIFSKFAMLTYLLGFALTSSVDESGEL